MPPKKGKAAPKTPATKAATAEAVDTPATITTSRGKEIEATAAAGRARRSTVSTAPEPASKKTAPANKPPAKSTSATKAAAAPNTSKKRGRPAKAAVDEPDASEPPNKRGRPSSAASVAVKTKPTAKAPTGTGRGRPRKSGTPAVPLQEQAPPKKRGRPPKGGETTKVEADEEAAADQLEEELDNAAEGEAKVDGEAEPAPSKQTLSTNTKKGKGPAKKRGKAAAATATAAVGEEEEEDELNGEATAVECAKQYWLMKAEQEDREETLPNGSVYNAKFTIDDLQAKEGPEPWDGVRNPTACKNMRSMKLGDLAFFYASGGKKGRAPGIVGIMEVVKEHEADPSAFDENHPYYVSNAKTRGTMETPRWSMVHVEFRKKLSAPVTLNELKKFAQSGGALEKMQEFTAARLSVSKVSEQEWDFIVDNLIQGYEVVKSKDGGAPSTNGAPPNTTTNPETTAVRTIESELLSAGALVPGGPALTTSRPACVAAP